jgi:hypothetical protein
VTRDFATVLALLGQRGALSRAEFLKYASLKSSVAISVATATTTALVSASNSTTIFVCGYSMSIASSATTANTAKLEMGTGATCGSNTAALTGTYGSNDAAVSTTPTQVDHGNGESTVMQTTAGYALCLVTAGNSPWVQGVLTYVQQNLFLPQ